MPPTALSLIGPASVQPYLRPGFLAVAALAAIATFLLYAEHPRLSQRTVVALIPWMVLGAALSVMAATADYPVRIEAAVTGVGAYLTTYAVACLAWFAVIQFSRRGRQTEPVPAGLGAMGLGAAVVLVGSLLFTAGTVTEVQIFWLVVAPVAAAAVAGLVLLLLGLWYPEAAAYTGMVGGFVIFGHALSAIATTVAVVNGPGSHSTLSGAVLDLVAMVSAAGAVGLDVQLLWAWGFVWTKLLIALVAVIGLTAYSRTHPDRGNLVLGVVGAVGVTGGTTALLGMVVG